MLRSMKNITASVLLVILFLGVLVAIDATKEPVFDSDGDELRAGVEYYLQAFPYGPTNGWLDLAPPSNARCPKFVIQTPNNSGLRRPAVFYPANASESVVHENSTDVNIEFLPGVDPYCRTSTAWKVGDYDPSTGRWWVTTGGNVGNPGPQTLSSWFKIARIRSPYVTGYLYYLRFCPSVCESCATLCNHVNMYYVQSEQQSRWALSPNGGRSILRFVKATSPLAKKEGIVDVGKLQSY